MLRSRFRRGAVGVRTPCGASPVPAPVALSAGLVLPALLLMAGCGGGGETAQDGAAGAGSPTRDTASAPAPVVAPEVASEVAPAPASPPAAAEGPPASAPDTLTGLVATFGAEPQVHYVLRLSDGRSIPLGTVEGSLNPETDPDGALPELARLTGARVRVVGTAEAFAAAPLPGFAVASYELLEVEGERPVTGRLLRGNTEAGTPDRLEAGGVPAQVVVGLPPESPPSGSRIWILGTARGDSLFVQSFGVLRPGG